MTQRAFARQMAMLSRLGFRAISIHQYARFRRGEPAGMPARPVLITFDGGRLDSYRGADRVLQRYGLRATMYAIAGKVVRRDPSYLTWRELQAMRDSGRWDVQPQAAFGHTQVAVDRAGHMAPFYAYRRYTRSKGLESFADWQQRATSDVFSARSAMVAQGFDPVSFAVPFGNYGQAGSNDPRIAPYMRSLLETQFGVFFTEDALDDPPYTGRTGDARRFELYPQTSADRLYAWLRAHDPAVRP
jgi:poly-beta-1,6-N-acetyl-D-glucosamine N-deacetylase